MKQQFNRKKPTMQLCTAVLNKIFCPFQQMVTLDDKEGGVRLNHIDVTIWMFDNDKCSSTRVCPHEHVIFCFVLSTVSSTMACCEFSLSCTFTDDSWP